MEHVHGQKRRQRKSQRKRERKMELINNGVLNLSSTQLDQNTLFVLSKGLGYVPEFNPPSLEDTQIQLNHYFSRIRKIATGKYRIWNRHPLARKKCITPAHPTNNADVEEYIETVQQEISRIYQIRTPSKSKMWERNILERLSRNRELVIKPADKEQIIVIQDRDKYLRTGLEHLSDENTYEVVEEDYTLALAQHICQYVDYLTRVNIIDPETAGYMKPDIKHVRTQRIYFLPKTHKKQNPIPVRPIVSGCNGPTKNISRFINYLINPIAQKVRSYIKDSKNFVQIIETTSVPDDCILVTMDVTSLYTNIDQSEGIQCALKFAREQADVLPTYVPNGILRKLLELVLHHNVFQFNGITYRQKHGTAMGTSLAPPFAILYMASLEEPFIQSRTLKPLLYKRYIDDVFMIWQHGIEELRLFIRYFNQLRPRIQLTFESSSTEINFLDTTVYKGSRHSNKGYLDIKPYFKSTNSMNYLHFSSTHPRSVFKGIVVGETTRFLRNSSDATTFENTIAKFKQALKLRGYPHNFVDKHIRNVNFVDRTSLLMDKPRTQMTRPIMVHCYHPQDGEIRNIISNHMNILRREPIIAARFPDLPLMSHTVGKTTHQFLIRASLPTSLVENNRSTSTTSHLQRTPTKQHQMYILWMWNVLYDE